jgi:AcrR family transcriptional regulator
MTAAAQVLVRDGYDRATTGLIAAAAGVSIGTVYQYFPNKDAIFSELLRMQLDAVLEASMRALAAVEGGGLEAHVRAVVRAFLTTKAKNPRLHRALKTQLGRLDGHRMAKALRSRSQDMTKGLLFAHPEEVTAADVDRAAFLVVHGVEGVIDGMLAESPALLSDPAMTEAVTAMVMGIVSPRASRARERA